MLCCDCFHLIGQYVEIGMIGYFGIPKSLSRRSTAGWNWDVDLGRHILSVVIVHRNYRYSKIAQAATCIAGKSPL